MKCCCSRSYFVVLFSLSLALSFLLSILFFKNIINCNIKKRNVKLNINCNLNKKFFFCTYIIFLSKKNCISISLRWNCKTIVAVARVQREIELNWIAVSVKTPKTPSNWPNQRSDGFWLLSDRFCSCRYLSVHLQISWSRVLNQHQHRHRHSFCHLMQVYRFRFSVYAMEWKGKEQEVNNTGLYVRMIR